MREQLTGNVPHLCSSCPDRASGCFDPVGSEEGYYKSYIDKAVRRSQHWQNRCGSSRRLGSDDIYATAAYNPA